jgi:hypothetical protein
MPCPSHHTVSTCTCSTLPPEGISNRRDVEMRAIRNLIVGKLTDWFMMELEDHALNGERPFIVVLPNLQEDGKWEMGNSHSASE